MNTVQELSLSEITISLQNTRKDLKQGMEDASLDDLARSIQEHGLLNPITVRPRKEGGYEVVAGQRRILAFRLLGLPRIPATIRDAMEDQQATALSLIENMQRADMAPTDKAQGLDILMKQYGSAGEVARHTGLSAQTVRRYLSLLRLPEEVRDAFTVADGSASIAVALIIANTFIDPEKMKEAWEQVKGFKASVAEQVIKQSGGNLDRVKENTIMAVEGAFGVQRCGLSLATCPYVPPSAKEAILKMAEKA